MYRSVDTRADVDLKIQEVKNMNEQGTLIIRGGIEGLMVPPLQPF